MGAEAAGWAEVAEAGVEEPAGAEGPVVVQGVVETAEAPRAAAFGSVGAGSDARLPTSRVS